MNHCVRDALPDHAADEDVRGLAIDQVGIRDLRWPVRVLDRDQQVQGTVVTLDVSVGLPADRRGTHMSRIVEVLEHSGGELSLRTLPDLLAQLQRRLDADDVHLLARFPYFVRKEAPVSGVPSLLDVDATFDASLHGETLEFALTVDVPVTSLCPCSKAISAYGAHNQRSRVAVTVRGRQMVWIEDVVDAIEGAASAPVYALLKREDEKHVTEQAYDNPRFVEDLVRETLLAARALPGVEHVTVVADNLESIHNHNAWARLSWSKDSSDDADAIGAKPGARPTVPAEVQPETPTFGGWLRTQRGVHGLSQQDLADRLGVTGSWISRVERGEKSLSADSLARLAAILGCDPVHVQLRAGLVPEGLLERIAADPDAFLAWARG